MKNTKKRFDEIKILRNRGLTLREIVAIYDLSIERIKQILVDGQKPRKKHVMLDVVQMDEFAAIFKSKTYSELSAYFGISERNAFRIARNLGLIGQKKRGRPCVGVTS
jgi:hypothetical protein